MELRRSIAITQGFAVQFDEVEAFAAAESIWLEGNQNILDVLPSESASLVRINYEDLVTNPEPLLRKVSEDSHAVPDAPDAPDALAMCELVCYDTSHCLGTQVCATLDIEWEPQMLEPYDDEKAAKSFKSAETVFVGDFKLFKRTSIDAKQADKWQKVTLPSRLRSGTIALARELGYTAFALQLPPELVWLKPPGRHTPAPPVRLMLCIHPGTGMLDPLLELTSHLEFPSLGLRLTARSLQNCTSVAHLEQRYWDMCANEVQLWQGGNTQARYLLGHSFGCRIAFAFAGRFVKVGATDARVVLMDGRIADQLYFQPKADDDAARALKDAIRAKHGDAAADNMTRLGQLPIEDGMQTFDCSILSECVHILYVASEEPMGLERVRELATGVDVVQLEGMHVEALQRVAHGEECRRLAERITAFFA